MIESRERPAREPPGVEAGGVKYEEVYPNGYDTLEDAYHGLHRYFEFYNHQRPHQALDYRTPAEVYAHRAVTLSSTGAAALP